MSVTALNRQIVTAVNGCRVEVLAKAQRIPESARCSTGFENESPVGFLSHAWTRKFLKRLSSEAAGAALWTDHDVCPALSAATHTDRVFQALHSVSGTEGSLQRRLTYVGRKNLSCCRRTIHIEPRAVQGCLNSHSLAALKRLLLRLTSRRKHAHKCQKHVSFFHNNSSDAV